MVLATGADYRRLPVANLEDYARVRPPRPRLLAGGTFGLAGVGAALVLAPGGSATPPAFAVTRHHDGTVLVRINRWSGIAGANRKLAATGSTSGCSASE